MAYLTVVIGLTQAVADADLNKPLCAETLEKETVCKTIEELVLANTSPLRKGADQMFFLKLSKTLEFYCGLLDLKGKSKVATTFGNREFQIEILNRVASNLVNEITESSQDSQMARMCLVTLTREANRDSSLVEEVLHKCYKQYGSTEEVIRAFFEADLLKGLKSVELGFQLYSASIKGDRSWTLKACFNCNKSRDLDLLILGFIQ